MSEHLVIYENISQCVTLAGVAKNEGRRPTKEDLGIIENASVVADATENKIVWVGASNALPAEYEKVVNRYTGEGEVWIPELIECHTHLIYAGHRHHDFALRCEGKTYQEIAAEGGGILATMEPTRNASIEDLVENAVAELERFQNYGVGIIEIKTGYGLTLESEMKVLRAIQALQTQTSVLLIPTFLPAHATPPEFKGRTDDYVDTICREWIPEVAKEELARFFDVFIEEGFFNLPQTQKLLTAAKEHKMRLKLHTDQFNSLGGTQLAVEMEATSVDHLDHISPSDIELLGQSKTVAVLLPGASLFTKTPYPPARALIDAGARVALSTDYNPGTCPSRNLPLMTTLACAQMGMTVSEALAAVTYNAAAALGLEKQVGSLEPGKAFRVCHLHGDSYETLPYCFGELN